MGPEDRLARLLTALDRLPRGARRALTVAIPIALLAALAATVVLAPRPPHHPANVLATHKPAPAARSTSTPDPTPPIGGDVGGRPVAAAIDPARAFIESHVAFSYGHARLRAIRSADPALVRTLAGERARVPPAQRKHHPRVVALRVAAFSPGVARATAVVADGAVRYPLVFLLDRRRGGWLVTRMAD
jgi:hypothetical protein